MQLVRGSYMAVIRRNCVALYLVGLDEGNVMQHLLERLVPVIQCFLYLVQHIKIYGIMC